MTSKSPGFSEGDPTTPFPLTTLLIRLYGFLKPYLSQVILASCLILVCIGLELALPFILRGGIDRYLVPYWVDISSDHLSAEQAQKLRRSIPDDIIIQHGNQWYLPVQRFRKLDPALVNQLRRSHAVGATRWYTAEITDETRHLYHLRPDLFVKTKHYILIADNRLSQLSGKELHLLRRSDVNGLILMALLFSSVAALTLAISYFHTVLLEKAGQQMMMDLRLVLYRHILSRSLLFFSRNPVGKLVTRINNDVQNITDLFRNMLMGLFKDLFLFAGIVMVMFALNAPLASVCILVTPIMAVIACLFARMAKKISLRIKGYTGKLNTLIQETVSGMTAIKLLKAESAMADKLSLLNRYHYRAALAQVKMFAVFTPLMELLGSITIALIVWYGGSIVIQDRLSLGTLVAFITYMQMLLVPVRDLSEKYNRLQDAVAGAERIFAVLDDQTDLKVKKINSVHVATPQAAVYFQSVRFGYLQERMIFNHFNLLIPHGQTVTLVGPSGGGKSTLINLLLRLYDPHSGTILLDGRDLKSFLPKELARRIALVSQEIILLSASIEENILLDRKNISHKMLSTALEISGVTSWLNHLPQGIHCQIGEGGRQLSQGQCQMLSLARALAGDPQILILDEAFSHIDPENERRIISRISSMMSGRICIIVAHRLSTARYSQRILVIRNGRIEEDGDHASLIRSQGIYAKMTALDKMTSRNGNLLLMPLLSKGPTC